MGFWTDITFFVLQFITKSVKPFAEHSKEHMDIYKGEQDIAAGRVHSTDEVRQAIAADLGVTA